MKQEWQTSALGQVLAVLQNGVNCRQDKSGIGDRISRIESISDASFDLERVGFANLSEREKERNRLKNGDILFSHINSAVHVGKTAVFDSDEPVYHGVNLLLMRPKEFLSSRFLEYFLKFIFQSGYWRGVCKQSVNQASVNQQDISRVEVRYPTLLAEQKRIVGILDEAFEAIVNAKSNAEKNLQNARELFESHLQAVFNERGDGWVEKRLDEIAQVKSGKRVPKGCKLLTEPTGFPYLRITNFNDSGSIDLSDLRYVSADVHTRIRRYVIFSADMYLSIAGTIGKTGIIPVELDGANLTENACRLVFGEGISNRFVYYFTKTASFTEQAGLNTRVAAQPKLALSRLSTIKLGIPSLHQQEVLANTFDDLREQTLRLESIYQRKLAALDELKKSLLHRAFNGEL